MADALAAPLKAVIGAVKSVLENAPAEAVTDIANRGVVLTGGGALLADFERLLYDETGNRRPDRRRAGHLRARGAGEAMGRLTMWGRLIRVVPAGRGRAARACASIRSPYWVPASPGRCLRSTFRKAVRHRSVAWTPERAPC